MAKTRISLDKAEDTRAKKDCPWMRYAGMVSSGNPLSSRMIDDVIYKTND